MVGLDTSIFIYQIQAHLKYSPLTDPLFAQLEQGRLRAVVSTLSMTELLVQPYRHEERHRVQEIYGLVSSYSNVEWFAPSLEVADLAAEIRAVWNLKTPDAILAATALEAGASAFITNDAVFRRIPGFETILLDDYIPN